MDTTTQRAKSRHQFQPSVRTSYLCNTCGFTRGSINHSVIGSNLSMEYAVRKGLRLRCQCSACACDKRVSARKRPAPVCDYCLADTHREGGLTARQMYR